MQRGGGKRVEKYYRNRGDLLEKMYICATCNRWG